MCQTLRRLARYVDGRARSDLEADEFLEDGIVRRLTVLGEAAGIVGEGFRVKHLDIPWRRIVGMRNIVTHQYDRVNFDEVWSVATEEAPRLLQQIETILAGLKDDDPGSATSLEEERNS
ncbi:MAG TPA: HepT-like ribonuclease domain-containing protein [Longimicrobium sp.]|nr:HepT-like ribonuclease domain-containing protein [Longimicrobium sp.]